MSVSPQEVQKRQERRESMLPEMRQLVALEDIADALASIRSELSAIRMAVQSGGSGSSFGR
jgi:hypothetical protein